MGADNRGLRWLEASVTLPKTDTTGQWAEGIRHGSLQRDHQAHAHAHTHTSRQPPRKTKADGLNKSKPGCTTSAASSSQGCVQEFLLNVSCCLKHLKTSSNFSHYNILYAFFFLFPTFRTPELPPCTVCRSEIFLGIFLGSPEDPTVY